MIRSLFVLITTLPKNRLVSVKALINVDDSYKPLGKRLAYVLATNYISTRRSFSNGNYRYRD